ncbi:iron transporter [Caulobacter sp. FWC26]|nr:iron transporter [Caulobacter sp. FWC26]
MAVDWPGITRMSVRGFTALVGGYAAAAALSSLLARLLPGPPAEASAWGMIVSFPLFAALGLWAFHARRLAHVAAVLWGAALLAGGAVLLLGVRP